MDQAGERAVTPPALAIEQAFPGDGEMARLMRAMDWSRTPLGSVETWSPSLRMMVRFLLPNRFPLLLWWGPEFRQLYNDPYRPVLGTKHPQSLGQPASECWSEIWDVIGPLIETPFNGGPATWMEDIFLEINRHGFVEETHFTIAYSPVPDETAPNGIGGVLATVHEISEQVVGERRVALLRDLGARSAEAKTAEEACRITAETLAQYPKDIPFALLYLLDPNGKHAHLAAAAGAEAGAQFSPSTIALGAEPGVGAGDGLVWPLAEVMRAETMRIVDALASRYDAMPPGPWADPPHTAVVVPIRSNIAHQLAGVMVAGVSPRLRFDDAYAGFFELASSQIATAIANARAYEEERKRAEALAEIVRAKTTFFSNVSHEFRTPLTLMLGPLADLLAGRNGSVTLAPAARDQIELIQRNGMRLLNLVNTLLDFARIEAGRAQAAYAPTDLAALTADLASVFRSLVEKAGLALIVDCPSLPPALGPVYVDHDMWEKIVLNLLSNAFKFTFDGAITVTLRAVDGRAVLAVRDTGTGIPPEELPRLFERFHRVRGARSRTHEGSGIGLALVQELVHLHGGTINVESAAGVGTTFTVAIPFGAAHLPAERIQIRPSHPAAASTALGVAPFVEEARRWLPDEPRDDMPVDGGAETGWPRANAILAASAPPAPPAPGSAEPPPYVLLADDNADMREYLRRLLGARYRVETVSNGAAALAAARRRPPDLVLTDVMMPEMDGFEMLRALRADPRTRAIPVILLSARAGDEATIEGLTAGADDYLVKPFSAREALARVAAHLEMARLRREAVARAQELETTFESISDAVFIYDRDGRIVRMNFAARALFGLDALPDYVERPPEQRATLISARDEQGRPIPAERSGLTRLLSGERLTGADALDVRMRLADGRELDVNITGAPLFDETGAVTGAIAISRDVTERRKLEREARANEARLRSILELLPVGVAFVDAQGKAVLVNQAVKAIWGENLRMAERREDYSAYKAWWPGTDRRVAADEWGVARALATGEVSIGEEFDIEAFDGARKTILSSNAPLRDETGAIGGGMSVVMDISERKRLERHTHDVLEALLAMAEVLVTTPQDADAGLLSSNESSESRKSAAGTARATAVRRALALVQRVLASQYTAAALLNVETDAIDPLAVVGPTPEIEARWWANLSHRPISAYLPAPLLARLAAEEVIGLDLSGQPPIPGPDYYGIQRILLVAQRLTDGRLCTVGVDVQDRPAFTPQERDLMRAAVRLVAHLVEREQLARERAEARTRALALEEANRRMDEFLGIASHELRTPLTSVTANVQLAERRLRSLSSMDAQGERTPDEPGDDAQRAHMLLERSARQLTRLDRLVGDLLDSSRVQAGKLEMRPQPCDLMEIVRDAVREQRTAWPGRDITLDLPRRAAVSLYGDVDRIGQVITNYLSNALKYSAEDAPVEVRLRVRGDTARVEVRDRGPGLTREQQEQLFERFYRAPGIEQQSGSGVGLGLGLYICRTIVERHGGAVGVESVPGDGATFWFTLPLA